MRRRWLVLLASVAILLLLVKAAGFRRVGEVWRSVEPRGILVAVACYYTAVAARVLCWRRLLAPLSPPIGSLAPPLALGFVLGHVTPAKSGEPVTAILVARALNVPIARTLSVLTMERALQFLVLLSTFLPAAAATAGGALGMRGVAGAAVVLAISLAALLVRRRIFRGLRKLAGFLPRGGAALLLYLDALEDLLSTPRRLVHPLLLSVAFWILQYVSLWAILDAGGASVNLVQAAAVSGAAILGGTVSMLPLGTQDGISAAVLQPLGVPLARGFSLALFHTVLSLACGAVLVAGVPWMERGGKGR